MRILGFIPARAGSKTLKNKNFKKFLGKPLIHYSVQFCKNLKTVTPFISSDSPDVKKINKKFNLNFDYLRPKNLSQDNSSIVEAVLHALKWLEKKNFKFDAVLLLQPTSPIRLPKEVNAMIKIFKTKKIQSIVSAVKNTDVKDIVEVKKNKINKFLLTKINSTNRQFLKGNFCTIDGSVYLAKTKFLKKYGNFVKTGKTSIFLSSINPMIDIDTKNEFEVAQFLKRKVFNKI